MGVDLRPYIGAYTGQGQTTMSEGAPAQWYNCTIECLRRTALDLTFPEPYDDEQMRDAIAQQYGYTGLPWGASVTIACDRIPGLAQYMAIQSPSDIVAQVRANLASGYLQHIGLWCDVNAWVPAKMAVTYSHACRIVADLGGAFALQNPEPHPDFTLTDAQMQALYDGGGLLVFKKSVMSGAAAAVPNIPLGGNGSVVGFTYRPANCAAGLGGGCDMVYVQEGTPNVLHAYGMSSRGLEQENLGGLADPKYGVGCAWSPDGTGFVVWCVGTDGKIWDNWWNAGAWHGWQQSLVGGQAMTPSPTTAQFPPAPAPGS